MAGPQVRNNTQMPNIYDALVQVIADHWKAHDSQYPKKIILTPAQFDSLGEYRRIGRLALNDDKAVDGTKFLGVPLEQDPGTPGLLIATDGSEIAIAAQ